jgi:tetratricopeptide (TPR) repeat protein
MKVLELLDKPIPLGKGLRAAVFKELLVQLMHRLRPHKYFGKKQQYAAIILELGKAFFILNKIFTTEQNKLPSMYTIFRGLNLVELAGPSQELALAMVTTAAVLGTLGLYSTAEALINQSLTICHSFGSLYKNSVFSAQVLLAIAQYRISLGDYTDAERVVSESMQISFQRKDSATLEECYLAKINCMEYTGRFRQSMKLCTDLLQSATSRGDKKVSKWAAIISTTSMLALDHKAEAIKTFEANEEWINSSVGAADPAKMIYFYCNYSQL